MTAVQSASSVNVAGRTVLRAEVEDFLYAEAETLDTWRYDDWFELFEDGARYEIPTTDYRPTDNFSPHESGSFVDDDYDLLKARVKRLKSRKAHAENPHSRTHRLISNVRISSGEGDELRVSASFIVNRARDGQFDTYVGWYHHVLVVDADGFRFRLRRSVLGHEALPLGARLSFIL